jgi:hypothetical protein
MTLFQKITGKSENDVDGSKITLGLLIGFIVFIPILIMGFIFNIIEFNLLKKTLKDDGVKL